MESIGNLSLSTEVATWSNWFLDGVYEITTTLVRCAGSVSLTETHCHTQIYRMTQAGEILALYPMRYLSEAAKVSIIIDAQFV